MEHSLLRMSPTIRYALSGMAYMADEAGGRYAVVEEVAAAKKLPKDFLAKIFQRLAQRKFLLSRRGPGGGYTLSKRPDQTSLLDILECLDETRDHVLCFVENRKCDPKKPCVLHHTAESAEALLRQALEKTTLADLKDRSHPFK